MFSYFSFTKSQNRTAEQVLSVRVGSSGRREFVEKGCRRVNKVQILHTHVCKWKMIPVETTPGMGVGG
jgi:hypothetical protein